MMLVQLGVLRLTDKDHDGGASLAQALKDAAF